MPSPREEASSPTSPASPAACPRVALAGEEQGAPRPPPFPAPAALCLLGGSRMSQCHSAANTAPQGTKCCLPSASSICASSPVFITPFKSTASPLPHTLLLRSSPGKSSGTEKRGGGVQKKHQMYQAVKTSPATVQEGTGLYNMIYTAHTERKNILFTVKCFTC